MIWGRVTEMTVGERGLLGTVFDQEFKIEAIIKKTSTKTPNSSTVRIYSLKKSTIEKVNKPNSALILQAGHSEDSGLVTVFNGDVLNVATSGGITEFSLGDGTLAMKDSIISLGFNPGVDALTVLQTISASIGLPLRPIPPMKPRVYASGFSFVGEAYRALDKICEYIGAEWSIQNNEIQILLEGGVVVEKATILAENIIGKPKSITKTFSEKRASERGLIGGQKTVQIVANQKTQYKVFGYKVDAYLLPFIHPGSYVQLEAKNAKGFYRVETVIHRINTQGKDFKTSMELWSVDLGIPTDIFETGGQLELPEVPAGVV